MKGNEFNKSKQNLFPVRSLIVLSTIGLFTLYLNTEVNGADWKFLGKTNEFNYHYDVESITHHSKEITRVQVKNTSINNKGKDLLLRAAIEDGKSPKGYKNYTYSITIHEIKCSSKMARIISFADYNNKNKILASHTPRNPEWQIINPSGIGDLLYKEVCR